MKIRISIIFVFSILYFGCSKSKDSNSVSIRSIFPTSGPPGTAVVVKGANFGINATDNIVRFNGDSATVLSSTEDSLLVIAPLNGTTGPITVGVAGDTDTGPVYSYTADSVDVYVSSPAFGVVYWKNGEVNLLESTQNNIGGAYGIGVIGNDVYVGGFTDNDVFPGYEAVFWKNGIKTVLSQPNSPGQVLALAISGNDLYLGGNENGHPVYWKNGVIHYLSNIPEGYGNVKALAINGDVVYAAGYEPGSNNEEHLVYWKDGVKTVLGKRGLINTGASSIATNGTDVFVCGTDSGEAVLWKNDVRIVLSKYTEIAPPTANAIGIAGNNIYVTGSYLGDAVYWKDGALFKLPKLSLNATATAICFYQNDLYIGGRDGNLPVYWKNGIEVPLCCGQDGTVSSIAVVKKK